MDERWHAEKLLEIADWRKSGQNPPLQLKATKMCADGLLGVVGTADRPSPLDAHGNKQQLLLNCFSIVVTGASNSARMMKRLERGASRTISPTRDAL